MTSFFVFHNRTKNCWSIRYADGEKRSLLFAHASKIIMLDCTFKVSEKAAKKVVETGHRTIHAGVVGKIQSVLDLEFSDNVTEDEKRYFSGIWERYDNKLEETIGSKGYSVTYSPWFQTYQFYKIVPRFDMVEYAPINESGYVLLNTKPQMHVIALEKGD